MLAQGGNRGAVARRFGISANSIYHHFKHHLSEDFVRAVRVGPFQSEERLRQLCAENGASVLDSVRGIYGGLAARWLIAYEAGDDITLGALTGRMHENLTMTAKLTRELLPPQSIVVNNLFALPDFAALQQALLRVTAGHPEVRAEIVRELKLLADKREPIEVAA